ncbi:SRPBCC domain-containing protein, partial [Agrococcus sp. HG114]|uniref:SRPBCC domain-containing protein n=1 Tax=Agrococcus sp. HG114 TaxID=2969757 RepID=UPI00215B55EF
GPLPAQATPTAGLAASTGVALAVVALSSLAEIGLRGRMLVGPARRALAPLLAAGAAPFTALTVHALLIATLQALPPQASGLVAGWGGWLVQLAAILAVGTLLAALRLPGPIERFLDGQGERFGGFVLARPPMPHVLPDDRSLAWGMRLEAPVDEVWRATTDPAFTAAWLADPIRPITRSVMDVRPGGGYRHEHADGSAVVGEFLRVEPPRLVVERMQHVGLARAPVLCTTSLREIDGGTVVESHERYESREQRDSAVALGLPFATASLLRLAALLEGEGALVGPGERWVRPEMQRLR